MPERAMAVATTTACEPTIEDMIRRRKGENECGDGSWRRFCGGREGERIVCLRSCIILRTVRYEQPTSVHYNIIIFQQSNWAAVIIQTSSWVGACKPRACFFIFFFILNR